MILIVSGVFLPEPVVSATLTNDLAQTLTNKCKVKVLSPKPSRPLGYKFEKEIIGGLEFEHIILNSFTYPKANIVGRMYESYSFGKHATNYVKMKHTEIKCIYINAWPLLAQYLIVKTAKKYSIPSVLHIQDVYPESLYGKLLVFSKLIVRMIIPLDKWILKNSTKVIAVSDLMKKLLVKTRTLEEKKIDVVYNWQDEEKFINYRLNEKKEKKKTAFTFMFLGNLNVTASVNIIILAFKQSNIKNSRLILAGNGTEKEKLVAMAVNFPELTIDFMDVKPENVPELQDRADVLLLNLKKDAAKYSLPSKLTAYMFSAKPVIACIDEESDAAHAIKKANCGWVVPPENIDALANTMRTAATLSKHVLSLYGRNGFEYAITNFSKKNNLHKLVKIIESTACY